MHSKKGCHTACATCGPTLSQDWSAAAFATSQDKPIFSRNTNNIAYRTPDAIDLTSTTTALPNTPDEALRQVMSQQISIAYYDTTMGILDGWDRTVLSPAAHMSESLYRLRGHPLSKARGKDVLMTPLRLCLPTDRVYHETAC